MLRQAHNSPKLRRLKAVLRIPQYQATGLLTELWHMTATQAIRGDIGKWTNFDIAAFLEWEGDPDDLVNALVECGWVDEHPDHTIRLVIHDWHQHADGNVKVAVKKRGGFITSESPARLDEPAKPAPPPRPSPDTVVVIPLQKGEEGHITTEDVAAWKKAYPAIDVELELHAMREWSLANPSKQKTARGYRRFVTGWLLREQKKAVESKGKGGIPRGRSTASRGADEFDRTPPERDPDDDPVARYREENQRMIDMHRPKDQRK